jgi:ABC-type lipoprotein export system ATPase subunit
VAFHEHVGDTDCPLCGQGRLDADWAQQARADIASSEEALGEYRKADVELTGARAAVIQLLGRLHAVDAVAGVDLPGLPTFNDAAATATQAPTEDAALATHLEASLVAVADVAETLRAQAAEALSAREDIWAPLAGRVGGWVESERQARELDETVKVMTAAKKWMTEHGTAFRNLRLEPIAAQARTIWAQLRQESNVDLGSITLEGTATKRRAVLGGFVDGQPTKALSVMSQGELHALALALFLPRATAGGSPFRFVVLDDPIQAMDPAKIDGFVQVLAEIARTHQVIVFSHDDRLASVIRETGVEARLVEVVRESESKVTVGDNDDPADRRVGDVFAVIKDDKLPAESRKRVVPGLFRMALETALREAYFVKQTKAGRSRDESEIAWGSAKKTRAKLALWLHDDPGADVDGWLNRKPERKRTLGICNAVHGSADADEDDAKALRKTVREILAS